MKEEAAARCRSSRSWRGAQPGQWGQRFCASSEGAAENRQPRWASRKRWYFTGALRSLCLMDKDGAPQAGETSRRQSAFIQSHGAYGTDTPRLDPSSVTCQHSQASCPSVVMSGSLAVPQNPLGSHLWGGGD